MGRATKAMKKPQGTRAERGETVVQVTKALRLMSAKPWRPIDLMLELDCSRRTLGRLLRGLERGGISLDMQREGRDWFYSISRETLRDSLGV